MTALLLADGPLTVLDLTTHSSVPPLIVLSACDTGRAGFASTLPAVLFERGCTSLVAASGATNDCGMAELMIAFHAERNRHGTIGEALAAARAPRLERWPSLARVHAYGR